MKAVQFSSIRIAATVIALLLFAPVMAQTCAVDAGADTTFCQTQGQLFATPAVPSPNYVFIWTPSTGLSDPNAQNPYVVSGVSNQQYIVQMNDTLAGCYTSDTIMVSAYYYSLDTITVCYLDSILLDFGPGATFYNWQFFTDTNNVTTPINANTQTYWATNPGRYTGFANFPGCGTLTSIITIVDSCFSTCQVDAGPATIHFCDQLVQLNATAISPGNDYVFSWTPANLLVNANNASVSATGPMNLTNQQFVITMTDTVSGCVAMDSINVYSYTNTDTTINICTGDTVLVTMPSGAFYYEWHTFIDTAGNVYTFSYNNQFTYVAGPGILLGNASFNCGTMTTTIIITWCSSSCSVNAGADTAFCQQGSQLFAVHASPGNYSFVWSPATGLDNPFCQNPHIITGVNNQQYVVTMTDTVNSCTATDTVNVSAYYWTAGDTFLLCNSQSAILDFGPGAMSYHWQFFTDTAGNTTTLTATTQTFAATQPGVYGGYAIFPGCGAMTSNFTVVDSCLSTCAASITSQVLNSNACGDSVRFVGTYSGPIGSWAITVNNAAGSFGFGGTPSLDIHLGSGTYTIVYSVWDPTWSCLAVDTFVYAGSNGIFVAVGTRQVCGAAWNSVTMNPTIVTTSTDLAYQWTPATGLSNPFIANPYVNNVFNGSYTLTVTDTVTGCFASDTTMGVYVANYVNDTTYLCDSIPVYLSAANPAVVSYTFNWSTGATTPGIYVSTPGQYSVVVQTGSCTYTSAFTVIDSCNYPVGNVWPGDCNYDLIVNMTDALHIGLANNASGPIRPNASNAWYAQPMADWTQMYNNCNYKHGDADGNGNINVNDTLPISLNYSLVHPFRLAPPQIPATAPTLKLVCTVDTVGLQTLVQVDVILGTVPDPVDSIYGISFRVSSEAALIDTNLTVINANNSWIGTTGGTMFTFQKHFQSAGVVDFAEVKNNHVNTYNGQGVIATFFIVTTDNLSGIEVCNFDLSDVTAVTEGQTYIAMNTENDSVVIDPSVPAGVIETEQPVSFSMYPNPANENVSVQTTGDVETIEICDVTGRVVMSAVPSSNNTLINTAALAEGIYMVRVKSGATIITEKLTITR